MAEIADHVVVDLVEEERDFRIVSNMQRLLEIFRRSVVAENVEIRPEFQQPKDIYFLKLPDGTRNSSLQILREEPTDEERKQFDTYVQLGQLQVKGREVFYIGFLNTGETFNKGVIDTETGWAISDLPWGRAGGFILWIVREKAGWKDPSGKLGPVLNGDERNIVSGTPNLHSPFKKENKKLRNPYAPQRIKR